MCRFLLLAFCQVIWPALIPAQEVSPYFHHLTVGDGLSEGTNYFIYKDSKGFVWLSSVNGLNRYDGKRIKTYKPNPADSISILGQNIQSNFFEDANTNLWFSTYEGLNCYQRKLDQFSSFSLKKKAGGKELGYYAFHLDGAGNLWIIVEGNKLYHFNTSTHQFSFQHELPTLALRAFALADAGGLVSKVFYCAYQKPGLLVETFQGNLLAGQALLFGPADNQPLTVREVLPSADTLWLATKAGLASYVQASGKLTRFDRYQQAELVLCSALEKISGNLLLAGFQKKGLFFFDLNQQEFIQRIVASPANTHGISSDNIAQITMDRDGGIWISTNNLGVDFYHPGKQKFSIIKPSLSHSNSPGNFNAVTLAADKNGQVLCGTPNNGIFLLDTRNWANTKVDKIQNLEGQEPFERIFSIFDDKAGREWILSWEGVAIRLPGSSILIPAFGADKSVFLAGCQLQDGRIVLAAYNGGLYEVVRGKNNAFVPQPIESINGPEPFVSLWQSSQGQLLGCLSLKSIWVMDPSDNFKKIQEIIIPGDSRSFCERPGDPSVWMANSYGLVQLMWENGRYDFNIFNEKNGLASSAVQSVLPDKKGRIWLGTGNGLSLFDPTTSHFSNYGLVDGISDLQFNFAACLALKDGRLLFGSVNGITAFYPEKIKPLEVPAHPVITNILINDQEDSTLACPLTGAKNITEFQRIALDYLHNTLSFSFAALDYSHPSANEFMYQMEGVDKDWVKSGKENFARYARLPAGEYVFRMKASNSDGIWSDERRLSIQISPPFTQTPVFYFLLGVLAVGLVGLVVLYRQKRRDNKRRLEEEKRHALEQERQRIARDVHDDLGSGLSALSLQTEMARYKTSPEELQEELERINSTARDLSGKIREVIWTVNARNDSIANLFSYLNQYAVELFENAGIEYQVSLPENMPAITITGEYRRTLFLAFKEALNNILKHAEATEVKVDFEISEKLLQIVVKDNGIGFDLSLLLKPSGNGLLNMQSRMRDIGGDCQFKTDKRGTQVAFAFNLASE
ncbi:MAG: hypothetical protein H6577_04195 [Lewinellaceae bacterium]|nr:hypothetical protein [Saprospiraceae bacterium]MCB9337306.1 hypothetical protein [Lewinellaceae bacterium]